MKRALKNFLLWISRNLTYITLVLFIIIPLFWMAAALAIRSGLFWGNPPEGVQANAVSDQVKTFLVFIGGGLATTATFIAALLTREHNRLESRRLSLDTTIKDLDAIEDSQARVAGVLTSMVKLGHPDVAMRILDPIWTANEVDSATATWLIDQVFNIEYSRTASHEASSLLRAHSAALAEPQPGFSAWPDKLRRHWNKRIPPLAKKNVLYALIELLVSRKVSWWNFTSATGSNWPVELIEQATHDNDPTIRAAAQEIFRTCQSHTEIAIEESREAFRKHRIHALAKEEDPPEWSKELCTKITEWIERSHRREPVQNSSKIASLRSRNGSRIVLGANNITSYGIFGRHPDVYPLAGAHAEVRESISGILKNHHLVILTVRTQAGEVIWMSRRNGAAGDRTHVKAINFAVNVNGKARIAARAT